MKKKSLLLRVTVLSLVLGMVAMLLSGGILYALFRSRAEDSFMRLLLGEALPLDQKPLGLVHQADLLHLFLHSGLPLPHGAQALAHGAEAADHLQQKLRVRGLGDHHDAGGQRGRVRLFV